MRTASGSKLLPIIAALLLSCGGAASSNSTAPDPVDDATEEAGHVIDLPDGTEIRAGDCASLYDIERDTCTEVFEAVDQCDADFTGVDHKMCVGAAEREYIDRLGIVDVLEMPDGTTTKPSDCPEHRDILLRQTCRQMFHDVARCRREADGARNTSCERDAIGSYDEELRAFESGQ